MLILETLLKDQEYVPLMSGIVMLETPISVYSVVDQAEHKVNRLVFRLIDSGHQDVYVGISGRNRVFDLSCFDHNPSSD